MKGVLLNALAYQLAWFACVKLAEPFSYLALVVVLILHFAFTVKSAYRNEILFLLAVFMIGFSVDALLTLIGVFHFETPSFILPAWLMCLWCCFATTIRYCLKFLAANVLLAMTFGAVGGASSYFLGVKLNESVSLMQPEILSIAILALTWALLMPVLLKLAEFFDRLKEREF